MSSLSLHHAPLETAAAHCGEGSERLYYIKITYRVPEAHALCVLVWPVRRALLLPQLVGGCGLNVAEGIGQ